MNEKGFENLDEHIDPPDYYEIVKNAAGELSHGHGLASYSGQEAVDEFQRLSETNSNEGIKFITVEGEITKDIQNAVAVLVIEKDNPSTHLYYKERFNQPVEKAD